MKIKNNAVVITSIIAGVALLIAIIAFVALRNPTTSNTITVDGVSSVKAMPNLVTAYFNIETKGATSAEVKDANDLILEKFKSAMTSQGFSEADLKTENFNIYPNTYWDGSRQKTDGFIATHSLKVELAVEKMEKLTSVIDAGIDSGAGVSYINFELTQASQNAFKAEALKLAAEDAQTKADAVAEGFGKKAGRLVSVQISEFGYYPWNMYTASGSSPKAEDAALARETAVNMQPSEQEISGRVSATFRIG